MSNLPGHLPWRRRAACRTGALLAALWLSGSAVLAQEAGAPSPTATPAPLTDQKSALEARRSVIEEEKQTLSRERSDLKELQSDYKRRAATLDPNSVDQKLVEQAELDVDAARVRVEATEVDVRGARRTADNLAASTKSLEDQIKALSVGGGETTDPQAREKKVAPLQAELSAKQAALELEKQHLDLLQSLYEVAQQRLTVVQDWAQRVQTAFRTKQEQSRKEALEDLQARLEKEQQTLLDQAGEWSKQLKSITGEGLEADAQRGLLEMRIQNARERAKLKQVELLRDQARQQLDLIEKIPTLHFLPLDALKAHLEQIEGLLRDLTAQRELLERKIAVMEQQLKVIEKSLGVAPSSSGSLTQQRQILDDLIKELRAAEASLAPLLEQGNTLRVQLKRAYEESQRRGLLVRRQLPGDAAGWEQLAEDLLRLPQVFLLESGIALQKGLYAVVQASPQRLAATLAALLGWLGLLYVLRMYLEIGIRVAESRESSFSVNVLLIVLVLLRRNVRSLVVAGALALPAVLLELPQPGLGIVLTLLAAVLVVKLALNLAWLSLAGPAIPEKRRQERLYRELRWVLVLGAVLSALTALVHLMPTSPMARDVIDRTLAFYLFLVALPLLHGRRVMLAPLAERFPEPPIWLRTVRLITLFLPIAIFASAALGVAGYINLAWAVAAQMGWLLVVMAGWLVARGVLRDIVNALKNYTVQHSRHGLLWTQGVIEPIHRVLRAALFLYAWVVLFRLYGWGANSAAMVLVNQLLQAELFTVGGTSINTWDLLITALIIMVVVWAARWTREVTYRWVYSGVVDPGARNSLAVFTQYTVVLVGVLVTLRVLGLSLTTVTVFAGALGVGIGFGLQAIANNFISGIILLIERPVRTGDTVNIGGKEGDITRIGIRSLTLRTWDNQEVIIPNADLISQPFTNWTRSDNVVRTVLLIGVHYDSDLRAAQRAMLNVLKRHPAMLRDPPPAVYLEDFADSAVTLRVQYYLDVRRTSRLEVKSEVLFGIWDALKAEGIVIPYPQRDIYIKEVAEVSYRQRGAEPRTAGGAAP